MTKLEIVQEAFYRLLRNIINFIIVIVVISVLEGLISALGPNRVVLEKEIRNFSITSLFKVFSGFGGRGISYFFYELFKETMTNILYGANYLAILDMLRGYSYGLGEVMDKVKYYYPKLIPVAIIYTLILNVLNIVPIIGWIGVLVLSFAFVPVYFLIEDYPNLEISDYFKLSYELTRGHKLNLFFLTLMVGLVPAIVIIVLGISIFPLIFSGLGVVLLIPLLIVLFIPMMAISMLIYIAYAIYYEVNIEKI